MSYLLDTNVVSELRKGERANRGVIRWFTDVGDDELYLSVLTAGELRRRIDSIQRRDREAAATLNRWLHGLIDSFGDRLLPIDHAIALNTYTYARFTEGPRANSQYGPPMRHEFFYPFGGGQLAAVPGQCRIEFRFQKTSDDPQRGSVNSSDRSTAPITT